MYQGKVLPKLPIKLMFLMAGAILLAACSDNKINRTNYNYIDIGMHYTQVQHHLGEPTWCDDPNRPTECRWGTDDKHIHITFVARRVVDKRSRGIE